MRTTIIASVFVIMAGCECLADLVPQDPGFGVESVTIIGTPPEDVEFDSDIFLAPTLADWQKFQFRSLGGEALIKAQQDFGIRWDFEAEASVSVGAYIREDWITGTWATDGQIINAHPSFEVDGNTIRNIEALGSTPSQSTFIIHSFAAMDRATYVEFVPTEYASLGVWQQLATSVRVETLAPEPAAILLFATPFLCLLDMWRRMR